MDADVDVLLWAFLVQGGGGETGAGERLDRWWGEVLSQRIGGETGRGALRSLTGCCVSHKADITTPK